MHASSFYLEYFDIMPQNTLAFCRAGCDVRRVENENPKGLARICSLPKSLVGRTLFLGLLTGVFSGFSFGAWKCACRAAETLWNGSGLAFESRAAAASHAVRSVAGAFVFVLNSAALSCAAFAAEWLLIYILARAVRNSPMGAPQYCAVWKIAVSVAFLPPIFQVAIEVFSGGFSPYGLGAAAINAALFALFWTLAGRSFSDKPPKGEGLWRDELSRAEFFGILRKSARAEYPHLGRNALAAAVLFSFAAMIAGA